MLQEINMWESSNWYLNMRGKIAERNRSTHPWYLNDHPLLEQTRDDPMAYIVAIVMVILKNLGVPNRFSPMNRRGPSDLWKVGVLVLHSFTAKSWDMFIPELKSMHGVLDLGNVENCITESCLRKFNRKLPDESLDHLIAETARLCGTMDMTVAIDATGYCDRSASPHYTKRILQINRTEENAEKKKKQKEAEKAEKEDMKNGAEPKLSYSCTPVRGFVKTSFAANVDTLAIVGCDIVLDHSADVKRIVPLAKKVDSYGFLLGLVLADKGYDSEQVHKELRSLSNCGVIIPARHYEPARLSHPEQPCVRGKNRYDMVVNWNAAYKHLYGRRSLVECVNSVIKRLFGGIVRSKNEDSKRKEIKLACVIHNILRLESLRFIRRIWV